MPGLPQLTWKLVQLQSVNLATWNSSLYRPNSCIEFLHNFDHESVYMCIKAIVLLVLLAINFMSYI